MITTCYFNKDNICVAYQVDGSISVRGGGKTDCGEKYDLSPGYDPIGKTMGDLSIVKI